ncbi:MAG: type II secretion system F family protein [Syntrophomonadaceae bacterium]
MELLISLTIFGLIMCIVVALFRTAAKKDLYEQRLKSLAKDEVTEARRERPVLTDLLPRLLRNISRLFAARSFTDNLQVELNRAGIPLRGEEYITISLLLIVIIPVVLWLLSNNLWLVITGLLAGALAPRFYIAHKRETRLHKLNLQLGDALGVMANALRAGFGFQQAMDSVRTELPAPISTEFAWALREMQLGFGQEEALLHMSKRVNSDDLDMVITGILIQRQIGGNLAEILDNISATIRQRARIKGEIKVLTAQGRMSGMVIGMLPVLLLLFMLIVNPDYINILFDDRRGLFLLGTGAIMMIMGIVAIKKIVNIDI